jgi:hypothetical protein
MTVGELELDDRRRLPVAFCGHFATGSRWLDDRLRLVATRSRRKPRASPSVGN